MFKETIKIKVEPYEIRSAETIVMILKRKIKKIIKRDNFKILHAVKTQNPSDNDYYCTVKYER